MEIKALSSAIKKVAVGYMLIYLHINIVAIDILPDWLGYFLIVSALTVISQRESSARLLRPFGISLGIMEIAELVLSFTGAQFNLTLINLVLRIIAMYFHFQLITNIANLAVEDSARKRLLVLRTVTVLLHTLSSLLIFVPGDIDSESYTYIIMLFMTISQVIVCLWITVELFSLSAALSREELEYMNAEEDGEPEITGS